MSDSSAQSSQRMVNSFVGNPNSAVGSLLKRGMVAGSQNQSTSQNNQSVGSTKNDNIDLKDTSIANIKPTQLQQDESSDKPHKKTPTDPQSDSSKANKILEDLEKMSKSNSGVPEDKKNKLDDLQDSTSKIIPEKKIKNDSTVELKNLDNNSDASSSDLEFLENAIAEASASDKEKSAVAQETLSDQDIDPVQQTNNNLPQDKTVKIQPDQSGLISQVLPQVIQESTDTLNPQNPVSSAASKEAIDSAALDQVAIDAARGVQQVELEPTPEISPEVESYLQKVEQHADTAPQEIVIADGSMTQPNDHPYPSQPVVVLPITPELEKKGAHKSPKFSIRWLVEWSKKIMKVFSGKVIYRLPEEDES